LITKDATTVIDGSGKKNIEARISQIKSQIEDATTDDDKENCRSGWPNLQVVLPS
jgi:chaperonin GroEL